FPPSGVDDFCIPFIQLIIITFFLYIFLLSSFSKKIYKQVNIRLYVLYLLVFISLLFLKNIVIREPESHPLSFLSEFINGDAIIVMRNIIMFIPLGWILSLKKKHLGIVVLGIWLIEIAQYVFHLGIFDVGDIIANAAGFVVGTIIMESLFNKFSFEITSFSLNKKIR
ncbi:VanZ family protein, partial [Enterococcus faecium]|nr:VanZ family protein [Enterococcus faecium]